MAAVTKSKPSLVAVDTNVLMDMADGHAPTLSAVNECVSRPQLALVVTPTVIQELAYGAENWEPAYRRDLAKNALSCLLEWGLKPINFISAGHGICDELAQALIRRGFIREEERNDSLVLAEAALCEASILLTWDDHLLSIPHPELSVLLSERHVGHVVVVSPAKINSMFGKRE